LLRHGEISVLFDCGLFQGHRAEAIQKNRTFPFDIGALDAVLLSHAHIDHSGSLPLLARQGYAKPIHCTRATVDLCQIMLLDSAFLQEEDAKFFNRIHASEGLRIEPLYNREDAESALKLFVPHEYDEFFPLGDGIKVRFVNAGHVLGSAMIEIEIKTEKAVRRVLFTGDLGRPSSILMQPPTVSKNIDYLLIESTYGNRVHEPTNAVENLFAEIINKAAKERGRIIIPSFALERTQEIVFVIEKLRRAGRIPPIHLYVDSPMATNITSVFNRHLEHGWFSKTFLSYASKSGDPFGLDTVRYLKTVEQSKSLNEAPGRKIIIAGSGMCEGGRVLHHLRNNISKDNTVIVLVGYQSQGTLGRRLMDNAKKVKIFGLEHEVRADVRMMANLSSHADSVDIVRFVMAMVPRPRQIFLVHGEAKERQALAEKLGREGVKRVELPRMGQEFVLESV
jgi:metallo-beta-lactamase family protein